MLLTSTSAGTGNVGFHPAAKQATQAFSQAKERFTQPNTDRFKKSPINKQSKAENDENYILLTIMMVLLAAALAIVMEAAKRKTANKAREANHMSVYVYIEEARIRVQTHPQESTSDIVSAACRKKGIPVDSVNNMSVRLPVGGISEGVTILTNFKVRGGGGPSQGKGKGTGKRETLTSREHKGDYYERMEQERRWKEQDQRRQETEDLKNSTPQRMKDAARPKLIQDDWNVPIVDHFRMLKAHQPGIAYVQPSELAEAIRHVGDPRHYPVALVCRLPPEEMNMEKSYRYYEANATLRGWG